MNNKVVLFGQRIKNSASSASTWITCCLILACALFYYTNQMEGSIIFTVFPWIRSFILFEYSHKINAILFYIPLAYASIKFSLKGAITVWIISMIVIHPYLLNYALDMTSFIYNVACISIPVFIIAYLNIEFKWRKKERQTLLEKDIARQRYLVQVFKAQEDERKLIGHEIHDDVLQELSVAASKIQDLIHDKNVNTFPLVERKARIIDNMVASVCNKLRRVSVGLGTNVFDDLGLVPSLRWLVDHFNQENNINAQVLVIGDYKEVPKIIGINVFRIVQEALNNIKKHSDATQVSVIVEFLDHTLNVAIKDNGKGFVPQTNNELTHQGKLGLVGMQQRAQIINGKLLLQSTPYEATKISIEVSLDGESPEIIHLL